jgi:hypothetical protein
VELEGDVTKSDRTVSKRHGLMRGKTQVRIFGKIQTTSFVLAAKIVSKREVSKDKMGRKYAREFKGVSSSRTADRK